RRRRGRGLGRLGGRGNRLARGRRRCRRRRGFLDRASVLVVAGSSPLPRGRAALIEALLNLVELLLCLLGELLCLVHEAHSRLLRCSASRVPREPVSRDKRCKPSRTGSPNVRIRGCQWPPRNATTATAAPCRSSASSPSSASRSSATW